MSELKEVIAASIEHGRELGFAEGLVVAVELAIGTGSREELIDQLRSLSGDGRAVNHACCHGQPN